MRQRAGQVFNSLVPTPAQKSGDFSAAGLNTIYDPTYDIGAPFNVAHINSPRWFLASATVRF